MPSRSRDNAGDDTHEDVLALERRVLGILLSGHFPAQIARKLLQRLETYEFRDVEHQVLFECAARLLDNGRINAAEDLPARLQERLIRAGFPDIDLGRFPVPAALSPEGAMRLCDALLHRR